MVTVLHYFHCETGTPEGGVLVIVARFVLFFFVIRLRFSPHRMFYERVMKTFDTSNSFRFIILQLRSLHELWSDSLYRYESEIF